MTSGRAKVTTAAASWIIIMLLGSFVHVVSLTVTPSVLPVSFVMINGEIHGENFIPDVRANVLPNHARTRTCTCVRAQTHIHTSWSSLLSPTPAAICPHAPSKYKHNCTRAHVMIGTPFSRCIFPSSIDIVLLKWPLYPQAPGIISSMYVQHNQAALPCASAAEGQHTTIAPDCGAPGDLVSTEAKAGCGTLKWQEVEVARAYQKSKTPRKVCPSIQTCITFAIPLMMAIRLEVNQMMAIHFSSFDFFG